MEKHTIIKTTLLRTVLRITFILSISIACMTLFIDSFINDMLNVSAKDIGFVFLVIGIICGFMISFTTGYKKIGTLEIGEAKAHFKLKNNPDFDRKKEAIYLHILTEKEGYFRWWAWFRALIPQFAGMKNYVRFEKDGEDHRLELHVPHNRAHEYMSEAGIQRKEQNAKK